MVHPALRIGCVITGYYIQQCQSEVRFSDFVFLHCAVMNE